MILALPIVTAFGVVSTAVVESSSENPWPPPPLPALPPPPRPPRDRPRAERVSVERRERRVGSSLSADGRQPALPGLSLTHLGVRSARRCRCPGARVCIFSSEPWRRSVSPSLPVRPNRRRRRARSTSPARATRARGWNNRASTEQFKGHAERPGFRLFSVRLDRRLEPNPSQRPLRSSQIARRRSDRRDDVLPTTSNGGGANQQIIPGTESRLGHG